MGFTAVETTSLNLTVGVGVSRIQEPDPNSEMEALMAPEYGFLDFPQQSAIVGPGGAHWQYSSAKPSECSDDSASVVATAPTQHFSPTPLLVGQRHAANEASTLIQRFFNATADKHTTEACHEVMIDEAAKRITKIQTAFRILAARKGDHVKIPERNAEDESMMADCSCIICYQEIADMVFLPCGHLAVCRVSLGLQERVVFDLLTCR